MASNEPSQKIILVVEDAPLVQRVVSRLLQKAGYEVWTTDSAAQALALCEKSAQAVDLLLSDIVIPGITAAELERSLRARFPTMKTLYMSGYDREHVMQRGLLPSEASFIEKVDLQTNLLQTVVQLVGTSARRAV